MAKSFNLAAELASTKYKFRDGLVLIEAKDEMNVTFGVPKRERRMMIMGTDKHGNRGLEMI